jgi:hypothetical protein
LRGRELKSPYAPTRDLAQGRERPARASTRRARRGKADRETRRRGLSSTRDRSSLRRCESRTRSRPPRSTPFAPRTRLSPPGTKLSPPRTERSKPLSTGTRDPGRAAAAAATCSAVTKTTASTGASTAMSVPHPTTRRLTSFRTSRPPRSRVLTLAPPRRPRMPPYRSHPNAPRRPVRRRTTGHGRHRERTEPVAVDVAESHDLPDHGIFRRAIEAGNVWPQRTQRTSSVGWAWPTRSTSPR